MRFKNPTEEEKKLDAAMDDHLDALAFEHHIFRAFIILYAVGFPLFILSDGWLQSVGMALTIAAVIAMIFHFFASRSTEKKRKKSMELLSLYLKEKSRPLFQELQEKFADDPTIRFIHTDDGGVIVERKREVEPKNREGGRNESNLETTSRR